MLFSGPIVFLLLLLIAAAAVLCDGYRCRTRVCQKLKVMTTTTTLYARKQNQKKQQQQLSQTEDDGYSLSHTLQSLRMFVSRFLYKTTPGQLILVRHGNLSTVTYSTVVACMH